MVGENSEIYLSEIPKIAFKLFTMIGKKKKCKFKFSDKNIKLHIVTDIKILLMRGEIPDIYLS